VLEDPDIELPKPTKAAAPSYKAQNKHSSEKMKNSHMINIKYFLNRSRQINVSIRNCCSEEMFIPFGKVLEDPMMTSMYEPAKTEPQKGSLKNFIPGILKLEK
jgi:hypothetical protein